MNPAGPEIRPAAQAQSAVVLPPSSPAAGPDPLPGGEGEPVAPPQIPDHELIHPIGHGAYGEVWLARHTRLGTWRAVKIIRRDQFEDARPFQREFDGIRRYEPISRGHPNLVAILHVGGTAGCFFYVMELADAAVAADVRRLTSSAEVGKCESEKVGEGFPMPAGPHSPTPSPAHFREEKSEPPDVGCYDPRTLRSELKQHGPLPIDRCLEIGRALASALAHLHARGLVHRDVKPSNVIFVGGVAKLADIGLVAAVSDSRSYVGTEGYIPPEGPGAPSADCYALGKLLYELSTGHDRTAWPEPPADLPTRPDRERLLELNAILHKACAPGPRLRYPSGEEMHADLELLCAGRSVKQRHCTARRWKFAKKAAVVAAVGAVVISGLAWLRQSRSQPLDPLTTGKNAGGYPPTAMRGTTNQEAWDQYRLGYFAYRRLTAEGHQQATEHFNQAIELDPKFALGYWGLWAAKFADTWLLTHSDFEEWRQLVDKMVALDNGLAETHQVLGFIRFWEWKWEQAEAEYRQALRLNPDCVPALVCLGFYLSHVGRTDEALQVLDRALLVDPNAPQIVKMKGHAYFVRRQFQPALNLYLESARREPLFPEAYRWAARADFAMTNYPAAMDELEQRELLRGRRSPDETKQEYAGLRRAFHEGGVPGFWLRQLDLTRARWNPDEHPYTFAQIHAWLGDKEQALRFLEKAEARHDELVYLIFDECWDPWRDEPRFEAVRQKVGLPRHPNFPAK